MINEGTIFITFEPSGADTDRPQVQEGLKPALKQLNIQL